LIRRKRCTIDSLIAKATSNEEWEFGVPDERSEQIRSLAKTVEFTQEARSEFSRVCGCVIGEASVFRVSPDLLVRIEIWGVGRQLVRDDLGMLSQVGLHELGAIVDVAAVPDYLQRPWEVTVQIA
jgi:hypothetical protein